MSKSKIFLVILLCFIGGVALRSYFEIPLFAAYLIFLACLTFLILFWQNKKIRVIALGGVFLFLGILRYQLALPKIDETKIQFYNEKNEITFLGKVIKEPDLRRDKTKLTLKIEKILLDNEEKNVSGRVLITVGLYPEYNYGDELKITGKLKTPKPVKNFSYDRYLARYDIYSVCYHPKIELIKKNQGSQLYGVILSFKNKLKHIINSSLPGDQAGILLAMTLGYRRGVSDELLDKFSRTATNHIMAISGLHITIISVILMALAIGLGLTRNKAFYLAVFILSLYILMIGLPASALRAGLMGFLVMLAMKEGRLNKATNALVFVAALILLFNPKLLRDDIGFKLSFLAVLGIIYLFPWLEKLLENVPSTLGIKSSVQITLSAQILTLPLIVLSFNRLSLVGPITNVLILPIMPFIMISGFGASFFGLISLNVARILFWPTWFLLTYLIGVIKFFSGFNFSSLEIKNISGVLIILIYLVIGFLIYRLKKHLRRI